MKDRVRNAIAEYDRRFWGTKQGQFNVGDLYSVCKSSDTTDYTDVAIQALKAGFMIGYRKGRADAKKAQEGRCAI